MRDIGPHSRPNVLAKLDGRRREARLMQNVREELTAHVGGAPSFTQKALIDRAAWLTLHVSLMDAKTLDDGGPLTERDSRQYLAWSNSLTRILTQLGAGKAAPKPPRTVADLLADRAARVEPGRAAA